MLNLKNTLDGYLKNVEVIGNTVQDTSNLADIRSVGDKVEGQELYSISIQADNGAGVSEVVEILSPVQLEKVGDVVDRIIRKDGVWGVEKNVKTYVVSQDTRITFHNTHANGTSSYMIENVLEQPNLTVITSKFNQIPFNDMFSVGNIGHSTHSDVTHLYVRLEGSTTIDIAKQQLQGMLIKYITLTPQFVPLPQDQQVKLRTFAGQTNISFLTEIVGQIKAQVPKSLGATVNTHTEQIANLNKELDRVKKLEENTVSTVETESSFTTVDATSNGYFEDVKLEGKTLVNLFDTNHYNLTTSDSIDFKKNVLLRNRLGMLVTSKEYTLIYKFSSDQISGYFAIMGKTSGTTQRILDSVTIGGTFPTSGIVKFNLNVNDPENVVFYTRKSDVVVDYDLNVILLEGDHTNNPPEYFEGLMSAGQDVEEVSVESVNENLFSGELIGGFVHSINFDVDGDKDVYKTIKTLGVPGTYTIKFSQPVNVVRQVVDNIYSSTSVANVTEYSFKLNTHSIFAISFRSSVSTTETWDNSPITLVRGDVAKTISHQSNKKPLLYYNPTTETWEKPVLREWDSIEKHSDGKYYYHKRSGEVVLNGSEDFRVNPNFNAVFGNTDTLAFAYIIPDYLKTPAPNTVLCDTFRTDLSRVDDIDGIYNYDTYAGYSTIVFKVLKGKLSTQDVQGFKNYLQANPTTVVYHLEQEEVYECTNIDLMTYGGETNYIINSGAISPKSLLKVHNNISNVVKILQEKVSLLENTFISGLKSVLAGDMYSLATILYPEDFEQNDNIENDIMVIPE